MAARSNSQRDERDAKREPSMARSQPQTPSPATQSTLTAPDAEALLHRAEASEARYRALIDGSLDAVVSMDAQGRIIEFNAAAERTFGFTRAAVLGQNLADLLIPVSLRAQHQQGLARYLATGESAILGKRLRLSALRADGAEFPIELTIVRLPTVADELPQFIASIRDMGDLRREEELRAHALVEAESARIAAAHQAAELGATFEAMTDGVMVYDLDGEIIHSNSGAQALFGYDATQNFIGLPIAERLRRIPTRDSHGRPISVDGLPQVRALRGETLTGSDAMDLRVTTFYGEEIEVSCSAAPLRNAAGAIVGAVAVFRDVTERRRLENELSERARDLEAVNARLRTVLHVLPVGVFIADTQGAFTEVNAMGRQIWGEDAPMLQSLSEYGTYVGWWPETGKQIAPEEWALARALTTGEQIIGEEIRIQAFDGKIRTALNSTAPIYDSSGAIVGGVVTLMDITERDSLTERTRQALDGFLAITQSLVGVYDEHDGESPLAERTLTGRLADLTRGVLGCSLVAISTVEGERLVLRQMAIAGLDPEQEHEWVQEHTQRPEQTLGEGLSPDLVERLQAGETLALDLTKPPYNSTPNRYGTTSALVTPMSFQGRLVGLLVLDFREQGPEGEQQPHQFTREEIQLAEAVARLGAVVLERERLLQEREATRARTLALEEANRRMDEFIGIAGHELRTPLTSVKANLQLAERRARGLEDGPADRATSQSIARLVHLLSNAVHGVERQERLVRDLLDISRISSGKLTYRMAPCDLTALTREITQELLLTAPERELRVVLPKAAVVAQADADRVGQVLTNYLTNALKYSPADRPITVTLRHDETLARVEVSDEGPGLTEEQQSGLFERFYRVEGIEAQSGSGVGLGLGLYISRMIVVRHGGEVGVESAPGEGTTFWFTLPLSAS